ncbi:hypothetical protein AB205_0083380, partial [Aquarana catesbeiana]
CAFELASKFDFFNQRHVLNKGHHTPVTNHSSCFRRSGCEALGYWWSPGMVCPVCGGEGDRAQSSFYFRLPYLTPNTHRAAGPPVSLWSPLSELLNKEP